MMWKGNKIIIIIFFHFPTMSRDRSFGAAIHGRVRRNRIGFLKPKHDIILKFRTRIFSFCAPPFGQRCGDRGFDGLDIDDERGRNIRKCILPMVFQYLWWLPG